MWFTINRNIVHDYRHFQEVVVWENIYKADMNVCCLEFKHISLRITDIEKADMFFRSEQYKPSLC